MPAVFGNKKLKTGEMVAWQKGKIMALRWCDKIDVCLMSTVHNTSTVMVRTKGGKEIMKPQVVINYKNTMGSGRQSRPSNDILPSNEETAKEVLQEDLQASS
ncbi:Hypothetical predicted protein [Pelobates cultripes]|uniref:PiggyBac transposable element-derived protein domain-containing protein n=1 Tax=Pelobates cultripes TaxID=61616 RepID=A0AAD1TP95_PELCU|nr:Hypothetical predicted protein [Pelobates cultripes]